MSAADYLKHALAAAHKTGGRREDEPEEDGPVHPALKKLRAEAAARGATLDSGGKGGLPPDLVLQVMRRDKYRCKKCGRNKNLSMHHKADLENPTPAMKHLAMKHGKHGRRKEDLTTVCADCHDDIHDEDRARGEKHEAA